MKRQLMIVATVAMLAAPALVGANEAGKSASSGATTAQGERGSVDAAQLTHLLEQKGVITREEEKRLTQSQGAPSVDDKTIDDKTMQEYFKTEPYEGE